MVAKAYCCLWMEPLTHSCIEEVGHVGQRNPVSTKCLRAWIRPYSHCSPWGPFHSMLLPPPIAPTTLTHYPLPVRIQLESFLLISVSTFFKFVSLWGLLQGRVMPLSIWAHRKGGDWSPAMHGLVLALSILCPRSATVRPGRRLVHVRGPSGQTPAGGGGRGSGGHLQPPDRDLSWAAPCCSPDLTQSLPNAPGHLSPGSAPRRSTGLTQTEATPISSPCSPA